MTTHRREPNKGAHFAASASTPPRTHYPASTVPFLSRSVEEMQNLSPYDSCYDSKFSMASGPGHPPSSRGNSDIDDQVQRYIRDQRVATIVDTTNIVETMLPSPPAINILNAHRIIARFHQTMAYRTIFPSVPPMSLTAILRPILMTATQYPHSSPSRTPKLYQNQPARPPIISEFAASSPTTNKTSFAASR